MKKTGNQIRDDEKTWLQQVYEEHTSTPFYDCLTGMFNYGFFQIYLEKELERSRRSGEKFALCLIDIDEFALFNKKHGEMKGELALKNVAQIIKQNMRQSDVGARYAGDVFAIIMIKTDAESARIGAERIQHSVEESSGGQLTVSAGLASCQGHTMRREALIKNARDALLKAKVKGNNKICIFQEGKKFVPHAKHRVLTVDDEPLNLKLLGAILEPLGYEVVTAPDGQKALTLLNKVEVDLVLLDVMMPGMDGFEVCRILKSKEDTRLIPVVLVTALDDLDAKVKGIEAGADDFISKPPNKLELTARIKSLLRVKSLNNNLTSIENVLISLANAVEAKDTYTQGHIERVSTMSLRMAKNFGLSEYELEALRMGSILHDIGKIAVPREILNKPGKLDKDEWKIIKSHPSVGYKICLPLQKTLGSALDVIRYHHEKLDGSGYPNGLKGDEISLPVRITTIIDIYDALITDRPYRRAMHRERAFDILRQEGAGGKLDKDVVKEFIDRITD